MVRVGARVEAARKRAGIVLTVVSGAGMVRRSGEPGVVCGDGGRFALNRAGRSDRLAD